MDKTEFIKLADFEHEEDDPDALLAQHGQGSQAADPSWSAAVNSAVVVDDSDDLMKELGI